MREDRALEALVVAHVFSDRAVLSAAGAHLVTPEVARAACGVEVGCDRQHPDAAPVRRWVASPGWRGLLPVLDEVPADAYLDPGPCPACVGAQRAAAAEKVFGDTGTALQFAVQSFCGRQKLGGVDGEQPSDAMPCPPPSGRRRASPTAKTQGAPVVQQ